MRNTAESVYEKNKPVKINAIQDAQGGFVKDKRSASADVAPEERKHSVAQGFLLNDRVRDEVSIRNKEPINRHPGKIYEMKAVREAQHRAQDEERDDPDLRKYINGADAQLKEVEVATQELVFGEYDPLIVTIPVLGMAQGFSEVLELVKRNNDFTQVIKGTNGYGGYNATLAKIFGKDNLLSYRHGTDDMKFDFDSFEAALRGLDDPSKVVLLLQADAYNYTGVNPTSEQKKKIVALLQELGIYTIVDSAYQGLVGDMEKDVEIARLLKETDVPFVVYDSYSKKGQLYAKRMGFAHVVTGNEKEGEIIRNNFYAQLRTNILTGTDNFRIVYQLLKDPELKRIWTQEDIPAAQDILAGTKAEMAALMGEEFGFVSPGITDGMFIGAPITHEGGLWMREQGVFAVETTNEDTDKEALRINMGSITQDARAHIARILKEAHEKFAA